MISKNQLITSTLKFTSESRLLSWYYALSTLLLVIAAYAGTYLVPAGSGKLAIGILSGLLMSRMFVIYHDYQHGAILKKSRPAKILMTAFGILVLAPNSIWVETHEHHHHHNSKFSKFVIGSFPVISTVNYKGLSKAQRFKYLLIRHPLMILFAYLPIFLVSFCLWPFFENPRKYFDCGIAAALHITIIFFIYALAGFPVLFYSLLLPSFVMYAVGGYIFYAQHNFPNVILRDDPHWDYLDAALYSSSYIRMPAILHWFTANIGYHHIHHVNSRIPFYRLPEVMRSIAALQHPRTTTLSPREVWQCLQLKLWDEDRGRLIPLREYRE